MHTGFIEPFRCQLVEVVEGVKSDRAVVDRVQNPVGESWTLHTDTRREYLV